MRQGNGTELFGKDDPRSTNTGIIYVAPDDDRESVLAALLTQEKLGRKQTVVVLPEQNRAFSHPTDFEGLKNMRRKLHTQIIITAPAGSHVATFARQRRFPVYTSLEAYAKSLEEVPDPSDDSLKGRWPLGRKSPSPSQQTSQAVSPSEPAQPSGTQPVPPLEPVEPLPDMQPDVSLPAESQEEISQEVPPISEQEDSFEYRIDDYLSPESSSLPEQRGDIQPQSLEDSGNTSDIPDTPLVSENAEAEPISSEQLSGPTKSASDEQVLFIDAAEELTRIRERLQRVQAQHIILVVPHNSSMHALVGWRLLHASAREQQKDVRVVSADAHIRTMAKEAGFKVATSMTAPSERARSQRESHLRPRRLTRRPLAPSSNPPDLPDPREKNTEFPLPLGEDESLSTLTPDQLSSPHDFSIEPLDNEHVIPPIEDLGDFSPEDFHLAQAIRQDGRQDNPTKDTKDTMEHPPSIIPPTPIRPQVDDDVLESPTHGNVPLRPAPRRPRRIPGRETRPLAPPAAPQPAGVVAPTRPTPSSRRRGMGAGATVGVPRRPAGRVPPPPATPRPGIWRPNRNRRVWGCLLNIVLLLLVVLLLLYGAAALNLLPAPLSSATVTITPLSTMLRPTYILNGVIGTPNSTQRQISARLLSYTPSTSSRTVPVTGVGHVPATESHGSFTFYNALSYPQTLAAGTVFVDINGIQFVNEKEAIIPAARPPTEGLIKIPVHSLNTGARSNIPALDFNNVPIACCLSGVTLQNTSAFHGGQDAVTYPFVQQSDIDTAATALKSAQTSAAQDVLKVQIRPNEQLVSPFSCISNVLSDHVAGERAANVTVSVSNSCFGEVYDHNGALAMAEQLFMAQAAQALGEKYALAGIVQAAVMRVIPKDNQGTLSIVISTTGQWAYRFANGDLQRMTHAVAGKGLSEVNNFLNPATGVKVAGVQLPWFNWNTLWNKLPDNSDQIRIVVQK